jgi:hypothetical protein
LDSHLQAASAAERALPASTHKPRAERFHLNPHLSPFHYHHPLGASLRQTLDDAREKEEHKRNLTSLSPVAPSAFESVFRSRLNADSLSLSPNSGKSSRADFWNHIHRQAAERAARESLLMESTMSSLRDKLDHSGEADVLDNEDRREKEDNERTDNDDDDDERDDSVMDQDVDVVSEENVEGTDKNKHECEDQQKLQRSSSPPFDEGELVVDDDENNDDGVGVNTQESTEHGVKSDS